MKKEELTLRGEAGSRTIGEARQTTAHATQPRKVSGAADDPRASGGDGGGKKKVSSEKSRSTPAPASDRSSRLGEAQAARAI